TFISQKVSFINAKTLSQSTILAYPFNHKFLVHMSLRLSIFWSELNMPIPAWSTSMTTATTRAAGTPTTSPSWGSNPTILSFSFGARRTFEVAPKAPTPPWSSRSSSPWERPRHARRYPGAVCPQGTQGSCLPIPPGSVETAAKRPPRDDPSSKVFCLAQPDLHEAVQEVLPAEVRSSPLPD
uniref:Ovule protein n=1 Tax=Macrostomum lignano TaxID=282301 RepID=A0A1I8FHD4_9PLAT